jgi:hypothetical protein
LRSSVATAGAAAGAAALQQLLYAAAIKPGEVLLLNGCVLQLLHRLLARKVVKQSGNSRNSNSRNSNISNSR